MPTWMRRFLEAPVFEGDEDKTRVAGLLNIILLSILAIAATVGIFGPFFLPMPLLTLAITGAMVLLCLGALFLMHRGYVQLASLIAVLEQWVTYAVLVLVSGGMTSIFSVGFVTATVMAALLLGGPATLALTGLSILTGLVIVYIDSINLLPPPVLAFDAGPAWLALTANLIAAAVTLYLAARSLNEALGESRRYAGELEEQRESLEETVEVRTRDLARRTAYLEATSEVGRDAVSMLDLDALLNRVVHLVSERFDFYHAGIFLLDPAHEWAVLQAASSEGGRRMLARGHRLKVGEVGIVGYVTGSNRPRIALDVGEDAVFFDNPDLPATRSEMALPLRARGEVIGALDVQSEKPRAFSDEDIAVLQTLADQVATAISNARLFQQAQESLEGERRAYGELSRAAWREMLLAQPELGFLRNRQGIAPAGDLWRPEMAAALQSGRPAVGGDGGVKAATLAIPIKVGEQVIGVIDARKPGETGEWTAEEVAVMETLTAQLGVALEGARLYQDTQRREARERLVSQVAARMRETLDMRSVLETAADELYQAMGLEKVTVHLLAEEGDGTSA